MALANFLSRFGKRAAQESRATPVFPAKVQRMDVTAQIPGADVNGKLLSAVSLHKQGELAQAELLYKEILEMQPLHFDALHYLGLVALQQGQTVRGVELIARAVAIDGKQAAALGNLALGLQQLGRDADAVDCYNRALYLKPDSLELYTNLSNALIKLRRPDQAVAVCDRALQIDPASIALLQNRGTAMLMLNRYQDAIADYERVLALNPGFVDALNNRGVALAALERKDEALSSYEQALALNPDFIDALKNRGNTLAELNRKEEALASHDRALELNPDLIDTLNNRGVVLASLNRNREAIASYDRALQLNPGFAAAHTNRGNAFRSLHQPEEALSCYERALQVNPDCPETLHNRGAILSDFGRHAEAAQSYARLMEIAPDDDRALGSLFYSNLHCCDWSQYEALKQRLVQAAERGKLVGSPFAFMNASESPAQQKQYASTYIASHFSGAGNPVWKGEPYQHEKIRVAYLSADFHEHATAYLMAGLFEAHDRQRFEIVAISFGPDANDGMRGRLQRAFDRFIDVREKSDLEVAQLIRGLEIDIAVDLKGFTSGSRTPILAHRPAPVQLSYLGYPGTMGAGYFDYILADRHVIPPDDQAHYSEQVVYLPDTYQVTDSKRETAADIPTRAQAGLPENGFVFCCFNNNYKITPQLFDIWMRMLLAVPGSVLWLYEGNPDAVANLRREATARGVASERLIFAQKLPQGEHLARMKLADLFLDTLPVNAHTTASDALWAGLPVLTCEGSAFAGRVAGSLLHAVGLPELVACDLEQYEELALQLASEPAMLAEIKAKLAHHRTTFPLFDTTRISRHIESAYIGMWERARRGEKPNGFSVLPEN